MGFAHYSTARKIAPAPPVRFSNAVSYRFVVFTIRGGQKRKTAPSTSQSSTQFLTDTLRSQTRRAERTPGLCLRQRPEMRAVIRGRCHSHNAFRRAVRALRSRPSSRLQASPPRHPPRRQSSASDQFANRSLAASSSTVIVLLIVLVHFSLGVLPCVITLHSFPTLLLYALKKNKKSAKVVRLMVSVKVKRQSRPLRGTLTDTNTGRKKQSFFFSFLFPVFFRVLFPKILQGDT